MAECALRTATAAGGEPLLQAPPAVPPSGTHHPSHFTQQAWDCQWEQGPTTTGPGVPDAQILHRDDQQGISSCCLTLCQLSRVLTGPDFSPLHTLRPAATQIIALRRGTCVSSPSLWLLLIVPNLPKTRPDGRP